MTRITDAQTARNLTSYIFLNRRQVNEVGEQISSGYKVREPGDSTLSGTINRYRQTLDRIDGFKNRISTTKSFLSYQDDALKQVNDVLIRAGEIATQGANETLGAAARSQLALEVFQLRDTVANFANSTYQGKYLWGGAKDDEPPYSPGTYTEPATGPANVRYIVNTDDGTDVTRSVKVSDEVSITVNTPADPVFGQALESLERLGRALGGYTTTPPTGTPDGGGVPYNFPTEYSAQTAAIQGALTQLKSAREADIIPERVSLGARLTRIDTAESLLALNKGSSEEALGTLQNTDFAEAATELTITQNALQASLTVTNRILNLSILDYL